MASPNLNEVVTTTLRNRSGKLADNVTNNNALLARLKQKGSIQPVSGGRTIVQELEYAQNGTYQRYAGYQVLNVQPSDVFTSALAILASSRSMTCSGPVFCTSISRPFQVTATAACFQSNSAEVKTSDGWTFSTW